MLDGSTRKTKKGILCWAVQTKNKATRETKKNVVLNGSNKKQRKFVLDDPTMQYEKDKDTSL